MCYSVSIERDVSVVERALDAVLDKQAQLDFFGLQAVEKQLTPEQLQAALGLKRKPKENSSQFRYALKEPDGRVYPGYFAPVIIREDGKRKLVPMRYRVRPQGTPHEIPTKYNLFNCRIDSLLTRPTWRRLLARNHALFPFVRFHEWVEDPNGKKVQVSFAPDSRQLMWAPALFDEWSSLDGRIKFKSVAIVTDDPPPEIADCGHDRCPIFLRQDLIDDWLTPRGRSPEELLAILRQKEPVYYHHEMAA
jgi:putative SOS response-associated peptidase YedK